MKLISFGISAKGEDHQENEDNFLIDEKLKLFAVADGVTIPKGGKIAAEKTIEYLQKLFEGDLKKTVENVNRKLAEEKYAAGFEGYTTLIVAFFNNKALQLCSVGDSPALLVRNGNIKCLTIIDRYPGTTGLVQVIGQDLVHAHSTKKMIENGDCLILATDGITDVLSEIEILKIVEKNKKPEAIARALVENAKKKQQAYNDDKTVVVVSVI